MKKVLSVFMLMCIVSGFAGCTEEEKSDALQAFSNNGCKNYATRSENAEDSWSDLFGKESITYEGTKDGCLMLYHNNVLFTCETEISAKVTIKDGEISIVESYNPNTNCICAYDLFMKIGPLEHRAYTISIYHNISSTLSETAYISFPINYSNSIKGEYVFLKEME